MLRAAICDDETTILNLMNQTISSTFKRASFNCTIEVFSSSGEFLNSNKDNHYDILFLDICMPDMSGFDIARLVRQQNEETLIVFITSQDILVYDSFEYRPFQFVRKGDENTVKQELMAVTQKLINYYREHEQIDLDLGVGEHRLLSYKDISFLKSSLHYIEYHLKSKEIFRVRQSVSQAKKLLDGHDFEQIHRQYIINLRAIQYVSTTHSTVKLCTGETLSISKTYFQSFMDSYHSQMRAMS